VHAEAEARRLASTRNQLVYACTRKGRAALGDKHRPMPERTGVPMQAPKRTHAIHAVLILSTLTESPRKIIPSSGASLRWGMVWPSLFHEVRKRRIGFFFSSMAAMPIGRWDYLVIALDDAMTILQGSHHKRKVFFGLLKGSAYVPRIHK